MGFKIETHGPVKQVVNPYPLKASKNGQGSKVKAPIYYEKRQVQWGRFKSNPHIDGCNVYTHTIRTL